MMCVTLPLGKENCHCFLLCGEGGSCMCMCVCVHVLPCMCVHVHMCMRACAHVRVGLCVFASITVCERAWNLRVPECALPCPVMWLVVGSYVCTRITSASDRHTSLEQQSELF